MMTATLPFSRNQEGPGQDRGPATILAADLGGTNLSLALFDWRNERLHLLRKECLKTRKTTSLLEPTLPFLRKARADGLVGKLDVACISGAGPVSDGRIHLTNVPWEVHSGPLAESLGCPVLLINDFTAIAHAVAMGPAETQLLPLPGLDGRQPPGAPQGLRLVVGAGTGLGVGFVSFHPGGYRVHASEGGHVSLPILDETGGQLWQFLRDHHRASPGAEAAVSGPGIARLFRFLVETGRSEGGAVVEAILGLPEHARPAAIARGASQDATCGRAMDLFVDHYARVCANLCATLLPSGGLFLAGGIAAKNPEGFQRDHRFRRAFERNYRAHLDRIMEAIPVFIVRDYGISLTGAAQAALVERRGDPGGGLMDAASRL